MKVFFYSFMVDKISKFRELLTAKIPVNGQVIGSSGYSTVGYVSEENKIMITPENNIDIVITTAHAIWVLTGKKDNYVEPTEEQYNKILTTTIMNIGRYNVLLDVSKVVDMTKVTYRVSDLVKNAEFDKAYAAGKTDFDKATAATIEYILKTPEFGDLIEKHNGYSLLALFTVAIHRHLTDGHSFFTKSARVRMSNTWRSLRVAGADIDDYTNFMTIYGHDIWHFVSNVTISNFVDVLSGAHETTIEKDVIAFNISLKAGTQTLNLPISEAAKDRWPPGTLGISSIILGIPLILEMIDHSFTKKKPIADEATVTLYKQALAKLNAPGFKIGRDELLTMRSKLGPAIAYAIGYLAAVAGYDADIHPSLKNVRTNFSSSEIKGGILGKSLKTIAAEVEDNILVATDLVKTAISP